jgi:2-methylcitrate dehydratase PrpD
MTPSLARALAEFTATTRYEALPAGSIRTAKVGLVDCIGVMIAGSNEAPVRILRDTLCQGDGVAEAAILFSEARCSAPNAAWVNGAAAHVLDYDDFARGHPSAVLVPAILAEADAVGSQGKDVLAAYVVGYEVWMDLVTREPASYQMRGLHPTPLFGAIAAAAACASLRALDPDRATHALGLAAAQASGLTASYGTMAKCMQVGRAAAAGVLSARMAANGLTADARALDHERGFLRAMSPRLEVDLETPAAVGQRWRSVEAGLSVKRYPVCYCAHRVIDGALALAERHGVQVDRVSAIEAELSDVHAEILQHHRPVTALEAKFSAEFAVSAALVAGNVGLAELRDEFVRSPEVQGLMPRVSIATNRDYDPALPGFARSDAVRIRLDDGSCLDSGPVERALGSAERPLHASDLHRKFLDCVQAGNPALDGPRLLEMLEAIERVSSVGQLHHARPENP